MWLMDNEPERMLELYQSGKILEIEDQLARDIQQADRYIKERVKQGMSELEAEDRAVELILAPSGGPEQSDNPPKPIPAQLKEQIIDRVEALEEGFRRQEANKVVPLHRK